MKAHLAGFKAAAPALKVQFARGLKIILPAARKVERRVDMSGRLCFLLLTVFLVTTCSTVGDRESAPPDGLPEAVGNAPVNRAGAGSRDYTDPDDAFALKIPDAWEVRREAEDGAYMTIVRPRQSRAANLSIMTIKAPQPKTDSAELQSRLLIESSKPFFEGWLNSLREQARVEGTGDIYPTRFDNLHALRMDVTYYRGDANDPRQGYSIFLNGDKTIFLVSVTGTRPRFSELEEIVSTIRIEP